MDKIETFRILSLLNYLLSNIMIFTAKLKRIVAKVRTETALNEINYNFFCSGCLLVIVSLNYYGIYILVHWPSLFLPVIQSVV